MRNPVFQTSNGRQAHNAGPFHTPGGVARSKLALVFLTLTAALALSAPPALAVRNHIFSGSFATKGPAAGQLELAAPAFTSGGELTSPGSGVAVNNATHDVYVADTGNHRVDEFSSAGVFVRAFGANVGGAGVNVCTATCVAGTSGSAAGQFVSPTFVAVDNSPGGEGDVYVGDSGNDLISKFTSEGALVASWGDNGPLEAANGQLAGRPAEPKGCVPPEEPCSPAVHFVSPLIGVAVDGAGNLWVKDEHSMFEFAQAGSFTQSWTSFGVPAGIALDGFGNLYWANGSNLVKSGPSGVSLGSLFPTGTLIKSATGLAFDSASDRLYVDAEGNSVDALAGGCPPPEQQCAVLESFGAPQLGGLSAGGGLGVDPNSPATEPVYVADAAAGRIDVFVLEPPGAPTVESESVSEVFGDSASFSGQVNPRGAPTEYRFEYGPCSSPGACATSAYAHSAPVPDAFLGSDFEPHAVGPVQVQELLANTVYHYRILAHNETKGEPHTATGEERVFTTQAAGGEFALPDARQWELVSPPDKHGAQLEAIGAGGALQAAAGGGAITYLANAPTEPQPQGYTTSVQVLSARGQSGWGSRDIAPPNNPVEPAGASVGQGNEYRFFSEDLSVGVVQPFGAFAPCSSPQGAAQPCLSEEATEQTAFLRNRATGVYTPLVTRANDTASSFTPFGEEQPCTSPPPGKKRNLICGPTFVGASPDASRIVLESKAPLTEGAPPGSLERPVLYEWAAGKLTFIGQGLLGVHEGKSARHAVSDDGSRVFFEGASEGLEGLLMRDLTAEKTVKLDLREAACPEPECESGGGSFQIASHDGSRVFFTSERRLTKDAGATVGKPDLYVYETEAPEGERLKDLTPLGAEPANVQNERNSLRGGVLGSSEDGSWVYFVANGVQGKSPGAVHGTCSGKGGPEAVCNLYVSHREAAGWGEPHLVAVLSGEDRPDWQSNELNKQTARVSPSGGWLAFMSQRSLTGYDNRDAVSGVPDQEVYLYDASTGGLACASCNPTGARPIGIHVGEEQTKFASAGIWPRATLAGNVPGWTPYQLGYARYQSRYLSDQGRLFFNSSDALVPGDVNGQEDVYQYEPQGLGGCSSAPAGSAVAFKPGGPFTDETREGTEGAGCVGLISSGRSSEESGFLDASANGSDVFFLTSARLSPQDSDTSFDVYDAHVCTSESPCVSPPVSPAPCTNESSCKPSPTPQPSIFGAPSSALFSGPGNLTPEPPPPPAKPTAAQLRAKKLAVALKLCRKKYKHAKNKRAGCEKTARQKYGAKRASVKKKT